MNIAMLVVKNQLTLPISKPTAGVSVTKIRCQPVSKPKEQDSNAITVYAILGLEYNLATMLVRNTV
jgi:hypothetical protein